MKKTIWVSALKNKETEKELQKLHQTIMQYGLNPAGHFWQDDLAQLAWSAPLDEIKKPEVGMWIIVGRSEDLKSESVRYGLACLAINVQTLKGHGFPILFVLTEGKIETESLPTPLRGVEVYTECGPSLGPKIAAKANLPIAKLQTQYRLFIHAIPGIGQWFEVNPGQGQTWQGALFGITEGEIASHGTGEISKLPERAVLEYPMKGLEIQKGESKYTAWAVKNLLSDKDGYFLGIKGYPGSVLFGPLPEEDDANVFVVDLT